MINLLLSTTVLIEGHELNSATHAHKDCSKSNTLLTRFLQCLFIQWNCISYCTNTIIQKMKEKKKQWKGRRRWTLTNNHILWKLCMYKHEAKKQQTTCFHPQWSTVEPLHPVGESECRPDFSLLRSLKTSTSARSTGSGHAVLITVACGTVIRMMAAHDESNKQWEGWK